ncbi:MAG: hypothetical protein RSB86_16190 [Comamonas sp.]|uniref:hypothetical protein n=1 Tax=Comamonas sp. TaxID=34028 RepID=UPI002FC9E2E0
MDFDHITFLASPGYASTQAAVLVLTLGFIAFWLPRGASEATQTFYWKFATLLAELLVAGGVIGLLTFAGRAKIESN